MDVDTNLTNGLCTLHLAGSLFQLLAVNLASRSLACGAALLRAFCNDQFLMVRGREGREGGGGEVWGRERRRRFIEA